MKEISTAFLKAKQKHFECNNFCLLVDDTLHSTYPSMPHIIYFFQISKIMILSELKIDGYKQLPLLPPPHNDISHVWQQAKTGK